MTPEQAEEYGLRLIEDLEAMGRRIRLLASCIEAVIEAEALLGGAA